MEKSVIGKTTVIVQKDNMWKFIDKHIDLTNISVNSTGF